MHSFIIRLLSPILSVMLFVCLPGLISHAGENANRTLFGNRAVQRELRLTEEQQKRVDGILAKIEAQIAREAKAVEKEGNGADELADREQEISDSVLANEGSRLMAILDERQAMRFWQIGAQASGPAVFNDNRVRRVLQLTEAQMREMQTISEKMVAEVTQAAMDPNLDIATIEQRAELAQKACLTSELQLLTSKQRRDFDTLMGEPFDLELLQYPDGKRPPSLTFVFGLSGSNSYALLANRSLQRELRLSNEQSNKIDRILNSADEELTASRLNILKRASPDFSEMDLQEKRRTVKAILDRADVIHREKSSEVMQLLDGKQADKLDQTLIQLIGARALDSESVANRIQLTSSQKSALAKLNAEFVEAIAPLVVVRKRSDFDQVTYDMHLEKLEAAEKSILTTGQREMFEHMRQSTESNSRVK